MNLMPATVGADPKKLAILGGLVVVLGGVYWMNRDPTPVPATTAARPAAPAIPAIQVPRGTKRTTSSDPMVQRRVAGKNGPSARSTDDFRPTVLLAEGVDVSAIDPSLRLDLLEKARSGDISGGSVSLFEFAQAPAPPPPKVKPIVPTAAAAAVAPKAPPIAPVDPPKPQNPPISLKFYGYAGTAQGVQRRAFFLDGEDIFVAAENDMVRNRYKIVRIGVNSAVVEDTVNKNQQTLPLVEELGG